MQRNYIFTVFFTRKRFSHTTSWLWAGRAVAAACPAVCGFSKKCCTFATLKIIRSQILPFKGFTAINLLGVLFVHPGVYLSDELMNHERIHTAQQREMLFVGFYVVYLVEWLVRLSMRGNAYRNISFEREAYANQRNLNYLQHRRHYAWRGYMKRVTRQRKPDKR